MDRKTAVVTGAASGIGRAIAGQLATRGDRVFALDRDGAGLARLGAGVETREVDVADTGALEALAGEIWQASGGVDLVFANAGLNGSGPLLKVDAAQFERCFSVNVIGAWATLRAFASRMLEAGRCGQLCVTGSEHSLGFQNEGAGIYTASKHAVLGLADVLRHELPDSISVSVLCPGLTDSGFGNAPELSVRARDFAREMMAEGLSCEIVAREAISGTERGDFIIATHAASGIGWQVRRMDVEAGFARVPPEGADVDRYAVPSVIQRVLARRSDGGAG